MNARINEKLGAWLLKEEHTKSMLAEILGMSRPTLNSRLAGRSKWTWDEAIEVAELTKCTLNDLADMYD